MTTTTDRYHRLGADRAADDLERGILAQWESEDLFRQSLAARAGAPRWTFFEGPPTANGRPGIHHVFARTIKDLFCRHRAMQGFLVDRKAGWDTHGLPVEIEVEKRLGLAGKPDIERIGVAEFNRLCRESVFTYRADWEKLSARIGYWLDYAHPYVTYEQPYIESVWWALKQLHERDLLFRGHKILPYCARCGTALSSHEVAQGYRDVEDPSVYVALDLVEDDGRAPAVTATLDGPGRNASHAAPDAKVAPRAGRRRIIVWTTTPWTLVSNVALAVNPDLAYVELRKKTGAEWTIILAEARAAGVLGPDWADRWDVVATRRGAELVGLRYRRPLDWQPMPEEGKREVIVGESFVSADDGSGVVHMAPAFGADDYAAGQRHGLAFVQPVDARGQFPAGMPVVGGRFVKDADADIITVLGERDVLWKAQKFVHSYPHCWRCGTPLLYYARTSWFVRTTALKAEMLRRNAAMNWNPAEAGAGRFGEWLENNVDWAISRDRYWGTPLPVWVNDANPDEIEVIGSYAELAQKAGRTLGADFDPHKPHVDSYTWPAPSGTGTMRRVNEVIDAWFDSGSMPFAQWHYPFENRDAVARAFPADFIAEGVDQTRGWFYSLLAIATGLGDALPNNGNAAVAPYQAVVVNDLVLDAEGQKMSKSRGNVVDPWQVLERHGADAARLFLLLSSQVWLPRRFDEGQIRETAGRFLLTLKNVYDGIFAQYANFGWAPSAADPAVADRPLLDRWVLSRMGTVAREADAALTRFDATAAARAVVQFVDEDLSRWYVRLSRDRFYEVDGADNRAAFATLHAVLATCCRLLAPFAPFVTDWMHRELTGTSVHLAPYAALEGEAAHDPALEEAMAEIRALATLGRAARETAKLNVRQPLGLLTCVTHNPRRDLMDALVPLLAAELNVKQVRFATSAESFVTLEAKANFRTLGKKFGKATPDAAAAIAALSSAHLRAFEGGEELAISAGGVTHALAGEDLTIVRRASGDVVVAEDAGRFVAIDPTVTPDLRLEGIARELVSRLQRLRKEQGLAVSDRVRLLLSGPEEVEAAARAHETTIAEQVLAVAFKIGGFPNDHPAARTLDLDGVEVRVALSKDA
ncbi:MAG: isoleucine--tRNA ligase [Gemmatimonadetes bacterium]|nr:isoleucine--tRNA ligase [Gemmatimonadota bacterium]